MDGTIDTFWEIVGLFVCGMFFFFLFSSMISDVYKQCKRCLYTSSDSKPRYRYKKEYEKYESLDLKSFEMGRAYERRLNEKRKSYVKKSGGYITRRQSYVSESDYKNMKFNSRKR